MSLSAEEIAWVLEPLAVCLQGARVRTVHDNGAHAVFLTLRVPGENRILAISASPRATRLHLVASRPPTPSQPRSFTQLLRKHLVGSGIESIEQLSGDRVVHIAFERRRYADPETRSGPYDTERFVLVCELTGVSARLILTRDGVVVGALGGKLRGGSTYLMRPPPATPHHPGSVRLQLRSHVVGDDDAMSRSLAVDGLYAEVIANAEWRERHQTLARGLKRGHKKLRRLSTALEKDLERAEAASTYKAWADVLAANFNDLHRGLDEVTLGDFYNEMRPVTIPLDPARSPRENIDRYYRRYKKYRDAVDRIETRYTETLLAIDVVEAARKDLGALAPNDDEGLEAIAETARRQGVDLRPPKAVQARREEVARLPYREFASAAGLPILVGKGSRDNDTLTFRHARGNDLWLHASGVPGSHVIVRLPRNRVADEESLLDAATLAAHYSRAKTGTLIEVHYTPQKYVRKIRGGPPGRVTMSGSKTLAVRIDENRLKRLLAGSD